MAAVGSWYIRGTRNSFRLDTRPEQPRLYTHLYHHFTNIYPNDSQGTTFCSISANREYDRKRFRMAVLNQRVVHHRASALRRYPKESRRENRRRDWHERQAGGAAWRPAWHRAETDKEGPARILSRGKLAPCRSVPACQPNALVLLHPPSIKATEQQSPPLPFRLSNSKAVA